MMLHDRGGRECGSVLIVTLWTLLLLCLMAAALGTLVSTRATVAWDLYNRAVCYHAARAGVEAAFAEARQGTNGGSAGAASCFNNPQAMKDVAVGDGVFSVWHIIRRDDGSVQTNYGLADEGGKINVNEATNAAVLDLVRSLIRTAGGADESRSESIAASIADWIDGDDQPRENGAEDSQYMGMSPVYKCHNGRMDRIEELMLVKGMDAVIFAGIAPYVTVYGTNTGVNINTADPMVLRALALARKDTQEPDAEGFVRKILEFRDAGNIIATLDRRKIRPLLFGEGEMPSAVRGQWAVMEWLLNHRLLSVQPGCLCGISTGRLPAGHAAERRITFVFDVETGEMRAWDEE